MAVTVADLRAEYRRDTPFVASAEPRLSWRAVTEQRDWRQAGYEIEVTGDIEHRTGVIGSGESVLVGWPAPALGSRQRVSCRVRVTGEDGGVSPWSAPLALETPLLAAADWTARFVTPAGGAAPARAEPCPYLRRELVLAQAVERAVLHVTALGVYEVLLNGTRVGDEQLAPGWSSYRHRLRYASHDVTGRLRRGANVIGAVLGDGWARGRLGFTGARNTYTDRLALLAQLEVRLTDGSTQLVVTDSDWVSATGPLLAADLYDGETYDARRELGDWAAPGYDASSWTPVELLEHDLGTLEPAPGPPVRAVEEVAAVAVTSAPSGETIVDFGQNLVGWVRLQVSAAAGDRIVLRHAEVLDGAELGTRPLRSARATDTYIARGGHDEVWEPRFTFHGFRYAGVTGWPGELRPEQVTAVVLHSAMARTGWFACSEPLLDKLHESIVWGMRGNFLDVPTDCPQRDERLGWTGDIQVFAPTATLLFDCSGLLASWLADLAADQAEDGNVPHVVPRLDFMRFTAAGWGDAATVVPTVLAHRYGDARLLRRQYRSMQRWVDHVTELCGAGHIWPEGFQFGDWLDPKAPPDAPADAQTDPRLVGTAWFANSARLLAHAAERLGEKRDARRYAELAAAVAAAFRHEFVTPSGRVVNDSQTAHVLALAFDLVTGEQRPTTAARLRALVQKEGYKLATGFLGTPWLCEVLSRIGADDDAYRVLLQTEVPSWLYPITMGATTIWERWDSLLPDGSINPGEMTSFNHYAYGAIGAWLYERMAGLRQAAGEAAWRRIVIEPRPGGGITHARAVVDTPYGRAESSWRIDGSVFLLQATVPPNASAVVQLPGADAAIEVGSGNHRWESTLDAASLHQLLPRPETARLNLDSPLAEIGADDGARDVLRRRRVWRLLMQMQGDGAGTDRTLRGALSELGHQIDARQVAAIEQDLIRL